MLWLERLEVFCDCQVLVYQHRDDGKSVVASIVARKPSSRDEPQ